MEKYNENAKCIKCGSYLIKSEWERTSAHGERMLRICGCCGYSWLEKPLDSEE